MFYSPSSFYIKISSFFVKNLIEKMTLSIYECTVIISYIKNDFDFIIFFNNF